MASHVFHEIYTHLNWHTTNDVPLLRGGVEAEVHEFLLERCRHTKGVYLHGIGGTPTHVHLALNIEPSVCISDLVGDLKGACSHEINKRKLRQALRWQRGFGVVSLGRRQLQRVLSYIAAQKEHHATRDTYERLERTTSRQDDV